MHSVDFLESESLARLLELDPVENFILGDVGLSVTWSNHHLNSSEQPATGVFQRPLGLEMYLLSRVAGRCHRTVWRQLMATVVCLCQQMAQAFT